MKQISKFSFQMITAQLMGGLGNQMFQYAAARSLAELVGTKVQVDLSWFDNLSFSGATHHKYNLSCFNLKVGIAPRLNFWEKISLRLKGNFYQEKTLNFNPKFFELKNNTYISGYFQSERYFRSIGPIVAERFTFKNDLSEGVKDFAREINDKNAVSVHVRRGDHLNPNINNVHGLCSTEYYQKCIAIIKEQVENPHFFVFSDDIPWSQENLKLDNVTFVEHNEEGYEDMRLMSRCRHNILANNSFSWWSAWLNQNPRKIVLAPEKWFKKEHMNTIDLIPPEWQKIS